MFDMPSLTVFAAAAALAIGYLLGSIPFGIVLTRLFGAGDLRKIGSGNIGATNVLRTGRKGLAAATLVGDALKGTAAVLLTSALFGPAAALVAGLGAFLGHLFPVWLRFKGGKGVATYLGVLLGLAWPAFVIFALVWLGMAFSFRYSSLAALVAAVVTPPALWVLGYLGAAQLFIVLSMLLILKHHENIGRLVRGEESKIELGKKT
jgi:glycerol-3-phosphate acyltransferase PlsY